MIVVSIFSYCASDIGQFVRKQRPSIDNNNIPRINIPHNETALKAGISRTTLFA